MGVDKKQITENRQGQNRKAALRVIILLCVICILAVIVLYYIFSGSSHETMKWAKKLSPEDVSCIELVIFHQSIDKQYKVLSDEELENAVAMINGSKGRYLANPEEQNGGAISVYLHMKDGSEHTVTNIGNVYLSIDGDYYDAGYNWLSSWPYKEGDSPLPYDFYGTPVLIPDEYVVFHAEILEINDSSMIVKPLPEFPELNSSDQFSIPAENMPPSPEAEVGDIIEIQYNGEIMESYPAQLGVIYGTSVIVGDSTDPIPETDAMWDRIPMARVNGKLYYDTGRESTVNERCGNMDGEITSTVDGTEIPTEDNQSNFGRGFGYQYGTDDTIEIYMNKKWFVFEYRGESE